MSKNITINTNCKNRVKPKLIKDMKTEALLVLARTTLENFFLKNKNETVQKIGTIEDTKYIYQSLWDLKVNLQDSVVSAKYLIDLFENPQKQEHLIKVAKYEEPLLTYYDALAKKLELFISQKKGFNEEFLILCVLSYWLIEENGIDLYPFLEKYDFLKLIEKFELDALHNEDNKKYIMEAHRCSSDLIETLKRTKYRFNRSKLTNKNKKNEG